MKKAVLFILCFVSVGVVSMSAATPLNAPASVAVGSTKDIAERLKGLRHLKEEGLITADEYSNKKSELLKTLDQKLSGQVQTTKPAPIKNVEYTQPVSAPAQDVYPVTIPHAQEYRPLSDIIVPSASFGMGLGKYGTLGIELNMRPSDRVGFSLGVGGQYYQIEYRNSYGERWWSSSEDDTGFAAMAGAKFHLYFTDRDRPCQHNIFFVGYYGEAIGPAVGLAYGFERHSKRGLGFDVSIGLAFAPDAEEYMADMVGTYESNIDYTWVPLLFEVGMIF